MPAVLMIESLTQVAAALILDRVSVPASARVSLRGVNDAKFRRNVSPGDRLDLEVTLGRTRARLAKAHAQASVDGQLVAEAELLLAIEPGAAFVDPSANVHPSARIGEGTIIGPHAVVGPDVTIGRGCRIGASVVIDGWTEIGDETQIYPMALDRTGAAGSQVPRRTHEARRRPEEHLPRVRHDQPRHGGRRRRDDHRRQQPVHGLRPRGPRLPDRQRHDLRAARHARRPRRGRGLREHQRGIGRSSVLPGREARLRRRILRRDQGRAAVRADDWQPPGPHLRRQHDRPFPPRVHPEHHHAAAAGLSVSPAVEAEHDPRHGADRAGRVAHGGGGPLSRRVHSHVRSAASSCAARPGAPRSWSPTNSAS